MKSSCFSSRAFGGWAALAIGALAACVGLASERPSPSAEVTVHAGRPGCEVEFDGDVSGRTDDHGDFVLREVDPSDHYLHVRCAQSEGSSLILPEAGQNLEVRLEVGEQASLLDKPALGIAERRIELRRLVHQAVQSRAQGRFADAVHDLRQAVELDPDNADLHRELGITFLLDKDWKRARVEMLEAIRHQQDSADAYNGLGYALEKLGNLKDAIPAYRTASQLDPDDTSYRQHYLEALGKLTAQQAPKKGAGAAEERVAPHKH